MRIRTIKPEFWSNEKLATLPDFARLVAIGLLNYADDEGYFWANPLMLRGALFPFDEDSSKLRRSLAQLSEKGYIKLGKTPDGRECGHVVNFLKHQRIDRPKSSEIKLVARFDDSSTNDRRSLDDDSLLEGKGREEEGNGSIAQSGLQPSERDSIYLAYPRKVGKGKALKEIGKALDRGHSLELLAQRTKEFAAATAAWPKEERQFIPHPATWFSQDRFLDDPAEWSRKSASKPDVFTGTTYR